MRWAVAWSVLVVSMAQAMPPSLAEARTRWLRGNLDEARESFTALSSDPATRVGAALGLSQVDAAEGRLEDALANIDAALLVEKSAALHSRRAELLLALGDRPRAKLAVEAALALDEAQLLARWVRSRLALDEGRIDDADADCRWIVRHYVARNRARKDIKDAEELLIVAWAGADNARWHKLADQFKFILNEVIGDAIKADREYWPAEAFAGQLLLEKHNRGEAIVAFDKALAINPRAPDALVGKGRLALELYDLAEAMDFADQVLEVNPRHRAALLLKADVAWQARQTAWARAALEPLVAIGDEEAIGRLAAIANDVAAPAHAKPARFHYWRAKWRDDRRRFVEARSDYEAAIRLGADLTPAAADLGMLVLRLGDENEARRLLADAFKADPFNVRTSNALKVLRHLEKYETIRTPHFVVRFDPKMDSALGRLLADYLERDYEDLAKQFGHRPAGPIVVEAFSSHEMFSGRIITAPDLHTVGATTGRVFAIAAPRAAGIKKPYNWARVMRHELTHIFNLDQSDFQVSHWLTEGLAVNREGFARPRTWTQTLARAHRRGELFSIQEMDRGFTMPRSPEEWTLAYAQAQLAVNFLAKAHGPEVAVKLMEKYRAGASTQAALEEVCGTDIRTIERGYAQFVGDDVAAAGARPIAPPLSLPRVEALLADDPDDPALNARAAELYLGRKRTREAREHANAALAKSPQFGPALRVIGQLYLEAGDDEKCLETLSRGIEGDTPDLGCLRALTRYYLQAGRADDALPLAERGVALDRGDPEWQADLARAARLAGDFRKAVAAQTEYLKSDADDLDGRRELARTLFELERWHDAFDAARAAIEIDPNDDPAAEILVNALLRLSKQDEAARWKKLLGERGVIRQGDTREPGAASPR